MTIRNSATHGISARLLVPTSLAFFSGLASIVSVQAAKVPVPNASFELPLVPMVSPYADTHISYWQKSAQPFWYDPSQNQGAPWDFLMGQFFNVPFPESFIDNCDGNQAAFLFAVPGVALFQDYNTVYGTNTTPSHAFDSRFKVGYSYDLAVGVIGGSLGMQPGATLMLNLYYRDASSNMVVVASTTVTNSVELFPTNTHFVNFTTRLPIVKQSDPWAGQHIGIQLISTTSFELAGGYWDLDNVRLTETPAPVVRLQELRVGDGQLSFTILSEPDVRFEIQTSTNFPGAPEDWTSVGTFTNLDGATVFFDSTTKAVRRYYRTRQL